MAKIMYGNYNDLPWMPNHRKDVDGKVMCYMKCFAMEAANMHMCIGKMYNGMPIGCDDDAMPWEREGEPLNTKYMYVCHAELNAILNSAHNNLKGARVYVTLFPCNECTKAIIQSGIAEVVYYSDKYHDTDSSVAARFMFQKAGVRLTPYQPSGRKAELEL